MSAFGWPKAGARKTPAEMTYTYNGTLNAAPIGIINSPSSVPLLLEGNGKRTLTGVGLAWPTLRCPNPNDECVYRPRKSTGTCATDGTGAIANGAQSSGGFYPPTPTRWVHNGGQNWAFADGHVKWRRMGAQIRPALTNFNDDPGALYTNKGEYVSLYGQRPTTGTFCHYHLMRPDFDGNRL